MKAASGALRLPLYVIQKAKEQGCPAFRSNRVYEGELLEWLEEHPYKKPLGVPAVDSPFHGAAVLAQIFGYSGVQLYLAFGAAFWMTMNSAGKWKGGKPSPGDLLGAEFFDAAGNLVRALEEFVSTATVAAKKLQDAGHVADPSPWLDMLDDGQDLEVLNTLLVDERNKFYGK